MVYKEFLRSGWTIQWPALPILALLTATTAIILWVNSKVMNRVTDLASSVHLHCESVGNGPDLTILHGLFGSGENWRSQAKKLSTDFTVHSMDARNHGDSPHTSAISYSEMAADVVATCAQAGIQSTHLLGHSMGGKTAMQLALLHPDLIKKLIIVDIGPRKYPHHHEHILTGMAKVESATINSRRQADTILAEYVDNAAIRSFLLKNLTRSENGTYQLQINLDAISRHYDNIAAAVTTAATGNDFPNPVLFIKGANSDYLRSSDRESVLALFPQAQVKTIAGAGHWPHSEKPDVVYKVISDFLTSA